MMLVNQAPAMFKKTSPMQSPTCIESNEQRKALNCVQLLVARDTFLRPAVLDLQVYDETLVVLTDHQLPKAFVENIVAKSWPGPVEVHCATELMMGA